TGGKIPPGDPRGQELIRKLEGFDKYIAIAGFRDVKIRNVEEFFALVREKAGNACVQFFDARLVAGWQHLYFAALNAVNAFKSKLNISNNLGIEILLYASAQRQIKEAVRLIGIHPKSRKVAVVIVTNTRSEASWLLNMISSLLSGSTRDDGLLELTDDKVDDVRRLFEISDTELEAKVEKEDGEKEALMDLVIEHVALLVTQR
ncbi:MAG: KEOPS complex subunit Cgi121, partial [Candidatus Bathyarchaeia archaeon]